MASVLGDRTARRGTPAVAVALMAVLLAACNPTFNDGAKIEAVTTPGAVNLIWSRAGDADPSHQVDRYEVRINGGPPAILPASITYCRVLGAQQGTYDVTVTAYSATGEWSGNVAGAGGTLAASVPFTPGTVLQTPRCGDNLDPDGDGLPSWAETGTNVFVSMKDTGTSATDPDTDDDGISDGDEVLGTTGGLNLPGMGASPLRRDLAIEFDWVDERSECSSSHSHRPSPSTIDLLTRTFAVAPIMNPDGSQGINLIADYGQGGTFDQGTRISDDGNVVFQLPKTSFASAEYAAIKASSFRANRKGYFHYALMTHSFGFGTAIEATAAGNAELPGNDSIITMHCDTNPGRTAAVIMHELGHNLGLRHGGNENDNWKPNYNSVMNYLFQTTGVDTNCDAIGDGVLNYSSGTRPTIDERAVLDQNGVCGPGHPIDFNNANGIETTPYPWNLNPKDDPEVGPPKYSVLTDHNDWQVVKQNLGTQLNGSGAPAPAMP